MTVQNYEEQTREELPVKELTTAKVTTRMQRER